MLKRWTFAYHDSGYLGMIQDRYGKYVMYDEVVETEAENERLKEDVTILSTRLSDAEQLIAEMRGEDATEASEADATNASDESPNDEPEAPPVEE